MRRTILIGGVVALLALGSALAFSKEKERVLKPATPEIDSLIDQLGDESFEVRQAAEKKILDLEEKAVPSLRRAAEHHEDAHVRREAARLLERLKAKGAASPDRRDPSRLGADLDRIQRRLDELMRRLEESGLLGERAMERMREMFEHAGSSSDRIATEMGGEFRGVVDDGDRRIVYTRNHDGGVKVEITENGETKEYEADSLEALKDASPEIHDLVVKHFGDSDSGPHGFDLFVWPSPGGGPLFPRETPLRERNQDHDGARLGVWVGEMSEPLRVHLGLSEGEGMLVESVVPGSLADRIGVRRFDVILTLNGTRVSGPEDVRRALTDLADGAQVTAEVIRKAARTTLAGTK